MNNKAKLQFFVIDDDPFFVELLTDILEDEGYLVASNCAASYALNEIRSMKPDCILVDLQMSEMDGLTLCREVRKMPKMSKVPIIMVSSHDDDIWRQKAGDSGANGYITKPIDATSFLHTVKTTIEELV